MPFQGGLLANIGLELAHFSGLARLMEGRTGGAGVILGFQHVRPKRADAFQPLRAQEVSPEFLDRAITALKTWNFDILPIGDVAGRAGQAALARRFVSLTFDGAYRDFMMHAYPVLSRHRVPFTVYVPTGFVDGIGRAWWLALEQVVARNNRIGLVMNRSEHHFFAATLKEKRQLYGILHAWMMTLAPDDVAVAIADLCSRYGVDLAAVSTGIAMGWEDLAKLARDPQATIASATVNYPNLAHMKGTHVLREMTMGRTVLENALGGTCQHFAYPFGGEGSFGPREILLAKEAGFSSAVTGKSGVIRSDGRSDPMALPRIMWDGRRTSLRALRVVLSGLTVRREKRRDVEPAINYG
ncbi:MAG: polysaccharide deacetylase [Afipia sp. 62-7]|nr:polysaccharide deacetylase family protein [Afipia sp.]OJU20256.1 MAG: polysaccharide deacetylase [Afipia sp. 62-7]